MPDATLQTISASEAAALYNVSPYTTRWMLYQKFAHGLVIEQDADNRMNWGKRMQSVLLAAAADDLKLEVIPNAADEYVRGEGDFARLGCTRDAEIISPGEGPGALEIKMVFDYRIWMNNWPGGVPPNHVEIQTQQQMAVGKDGVPFTWGVIGVFVCGEMHYFRRKPIPKLWDATDPESLPAMAGQFFADVAAKNEPNPFGAVIEVPLMNQVFTTVKGKTTDFVAQLGEDEARAWSEKIRMMDWHADERLMHEKGEKKIKAELMALMQDAEFGLFANGVTVKLKEQDRAGYTVKPVTFKVLSVHVPADLGDSLQPFQNKSFE